MNTSWNWKTNISITALSKTENRNTGTKPPNNIRGALYAGAHGDPDIYLYGGTVSWANKSFSGFQWPTAATYSLWGYGTTDKTWDQYDVSLNVPNRPAGGASTEATDRGLAFYLGGFVNNGSSSDYARLSPDFKQYLNGLVVINNFKRSKQHNHLIARELPPCTRWTGLYPQHRLRRDTSVYGWDDNRQICTLPPEGSPKPKYTLTVMGM